MAKLYFNYSTMNAGKSAVLLQASHNYRENHMDTYLLTAQIDSRAGEGRIASRIGISEAADTFAPGEDLFAKIKKLLPAPQITEKPSMVRLPKADSLPPSSTRRNPSTLACNY